MSLGFASREGSSRSAEVGPPPDSVYYGVEEDGNDQGCEKEVMRAL